MEKREEFDLVMNYMVEDVLSVCKHAFLVSESWWNEWLRFMDSGLDWKERPKNMKNYFCLSSFDIVEKNYKLIHPCAWEVFRKSYECRPEIVVFINDKQPDLKPINIYVFTVDKKQEVLMASRKMSVEDLKEFITQTHFAGLIQGYLEFNTKRLEDESRSLESVGIKAGSNVYFRDFGYVGSTSSRPVNEKQEKNHAGYSEGRVNNEEFMEPDPCPISYFPQTSSSTFPIKPNQFPEATVLQMVKSALEQGFFDLKPLPPHQINENLSEFERTEYDF